MMAILGPQESRDGTSSAERVADPLQEQAVKELVADRVPSVPAEATSEAQCRGL
jgi:hypothetical protein